MSSSPTLCDVTETEKTSDQQPGYTPRKGRPTPSRREAQAARQRPLVPADRKAAKRKNRERIAAARSAQQSALMRGDEANYPLAHAGAERRYARDIVDSRFNLGEWFLPFAIVALAAPLIVQVMNPALYQKIGLPLMLMLWAAIVLVVIDLFVLRRKLKRMMTERFGTYPPGMTSYSLLRATNMRRLRIPKPQVKRGDQPRR